MATFRVRASGSIEAIIRRKSLPGPVSLTFSSMEAAEAYCKEMEAMIDVGVIPHQLKKLAVDGPVMNSPMQQTIADVVRAYFLEYSVNADDQDRLNVMVDEVGNTRLDSITVQWASDLIKGYKLTKQLKPATIRHRVGALRRCLDWCSSVKGFLPLNPLRLLPERYAVYNEAETQMLAAEDIEAPDADNARDRRLLPGEEDRIRKVLAGDRDYIKSVKAERALKPENAVPFALLFELAVETAMRLREMFTLTLGQVSIEQKTVFLDKTKNGSKRQVPLTSVAILALRDYLALGVVGESGMLFPQFWNGDLSKRSLKQATSRLSGRWRTVAKLARCDDLHFHDLRHEATSRIYERTTLSDLKIAKITGHKDLKSLARYANLRASNLADEMW